MPAFMLKNAPMLLAIRIMFSYLLFSPWDTGKEIYDAVEELKGKFENVIPRTECLIVQAYYFAIRK